MVQYKKSEISHEIKQSAIVLFSQKGYSNTTVDDIANLANISVGNVYRYYRSKKLIYEDLISDAFITDFKNILNDKILNHLDDNSFFSFIITNKEKFVLLFTDAKNTKYENLAHELIEYMTNIVYKNYFGNTDKHNVDLIKIIYQNYIESMKWIIKNHSSIEDILLHLNKLNLYHNSGIIALIKGETK